MFFVCKVPLHVRANLTSLQHPPTNLQHNATETDGNNPLQGRNLSRIFAGRPFPSISSKSAYSSRKGVLPFSTFYLQLFSQPLKLSA